MLPLSQRSWSVGALCAVLLSSLAPVSAQNAAVTINVDANANRHAINPNIYGVAFGTTAQLAELNCPLNRNGGNNTSRYNWQLNADNKGWDWYFESIGRASATPGEMGDTFISEAQAAGAQAMLTLPMIGWVARLGAGRAKLCSFSQAKYGAQEDWDYNWFEDAGNGILAATGRQITGNNPNDANVAVDALFQQGWVQHLVTTWGTAANGGLRYYILDNEPGLWHETHVDVHPVGASYDEMLAKVLDYAGKVKDVDPSALVVGPEEWGWGDFYSGYDKQSGDTNGWGFLPDRAAHGNMEYLPWLLDQLRQKHNTTGRRLLDVLTVHYYPQSGEFSSTVTTTRQLLRNRSTRSLWDPNYVDESWINDRVQLIPKLKSWIATYYPGTQVGVTEYNWGADDHMNGATTQADIWGIFGREGLDMGARWGTPAATTPTFKAMKMFRNYDGNKSGFGETSVQATSTANPDNVSAFAAQRTADNALTVMVIAKYLSNTTPVTVNLANFTPATAAQAWRLTSAKAITRLADVSISNGTLAATVPPQSITLFVIPASGNAPPPPPPSSPAFTSSATASPATVRRRKKTTIQLTVTDTGGPLAGGIVDLEIYNSAGTRVTQTYWSAQDFDAGRARAYSYTWTAPRSAGTYTVKVGVFGPNWTPTYHWNNAATTIRVQ